MTLEQKIDICLRLVASLDYEAIREIAADYSEAENCIIDACSALEEPTTPSCDTSLDDAISDLLKELGVSTANFGHRYLHTAIRLCVEDPTYRDNITHRLYPDTGTAHGKTGYQVERSIRHSIDNAFLKGDPDAQYKLFGNTIAFDGKPTNSGFITACAIEVKRRMRGAK